MPFIMKHVRTLILLLIVIYVHSCSEDSDDIEEWDGFYYIGFEINSFKPCGLDESWWVTGEDEPLEEFFSKYYEVADDGCEVYIRVNGIKTEKGSYGHMGASDREFEVTETLEVRCRQEGDCQ